MNYTQSTSMTEQQSMADLLSSEKFMTAIYNNFCCECATPAVKNCLCSLLQDEHRMQDRIFHEMSERGWYAVEKAEEQKINAARMKFEKNVTV